MQEHGRRAGPAKALAAACRLTGLSGRAVGQHYDGISASAVSNIRRRVHENRADILPVVDRLP